MAKTTQPILCCLGEQVAGSPTQFVIDRLLCATDLDWRVFTTEIRQEDIEAAVRGVAALHFSALRIVGGSRALEQAVFELILREEPWSSLEVSCNAACFDQTWSGWNSECAGLLWLLTRVTLPKPKRVAVYIYGDSELTRGVFHAYQIARQLEQVDDCKLHWIGGPDEAVLASGDDDSLRSYEIYAQLGDFQQSLETGEDQPESETKEPAAELFVADGKGEVRSLLAAAQRETTGTGILCCSSTEWKLAMNNGKALRRTGDDEALGLVSPVDLASAALAHDFHRWTDTSANFQAIREAYEEFCEF